VTRAAPAASLAAGVALLLGVCTAAPAQTAVTGTLPVARVGVLRVDPGPDRIEELRDGLREHGWVEGRTVVLEIRSADGQIPRLPELAADLVRRHVDVIVTHGASGVRAAQQATRTIPIVMGRMDDADSHGLVTNLARPEGNVTGLSFQARELTGKWLQLLKEAVPRLDRVAILSDADEPASQLRAAQDAARSLGLAVRAVQVRASAELPDVFETLHRERVRALLILGSARLTGEAERLGELAAGARLASLYYHERFSAAGGLLSYGPRESEFSWRRAAVFVDRLLRGARPADLPVEQPTRFDLVVNLRTAGLLGLTVPQSVLLSADRVIR